jgi:hypothetical protein
MTAPWQRSWLKSKDCPLIFVRDVLGAIPEPWQAEALEAVGKHDRVSIRSGHGVGKTTFESWLILWFLLTRQNCKIPVAANSQDQLRDTIWPEIAKWHRQLPDALKANIDVQAERVVVVHDPEGAFAVRRTASKDNPEALQGFHAEHLLFLIDEASGKEARRSGPHRRTIRGRARLYHPNPQPNRDVLVSYDPSVLAG